MSNQPPRVPSMFEQLMSAAAGAARAKADAQRPPWPMNPFQPGIRAGSVTDRVLQVLIANYPRWHEHNELMRLTGGTRGAIAWGVGYLQRYGLVRAIPSARHPKYLRYRAVSQ